MQKRSFTEEEADLVLSTLLDIILESKYDKAAQVRHLMGRDCVLCICNSFKAMSWLLSQECHGFQQKRHYTSRTGHAKAMVRTGCPTRHCCRKIAEACL